MIGLDRAILTTANDFDEMVREIQYLNLRTAPAFEVIQSNQIITEDVIRNVMVEKEKAN